MKLILAQPYLNLRGGVERVILEVAKHYDAKIYTLEYNKAQTFEGFEDLDVEIIGKDVPLADKLPYRASQGLRYGYNFYNIKLKEDYDVLNSHISPSEWIRHKNERVLWYCHTPPREVYDLYETRMHNRSYKQKLLYAALVGTYKLMSRGITKKIEQIATNSNTTKARIKKYYARDATVINPGLDVRDFHNDGDAKYFLYPSRIVINKRQDYVINAFSQFVKKSKDASKYKLVLAGTLSNDPEHQKYFEKLKALAKGLGVSFKTNLDDAELKKLYSNASAVLFAAINEDYGYIPIESMASAKPIISVKEGGPTETIQDAKTGFLVSSPSEMAERMMYIAENKDAAEEMGKAGRKLVEKKYSWEAFFEKFDPILDEVAKK
ncbi:MAG: glycosyltransferase [Candidatus Micrarchaeota archaeon]|nr:glycosyltransferase [Candidatus Micrarchaeota archaeon]MDE1859028.1 glycosyltransferase [Candidatus Micrarchaeota archaeon]